MPNPLFATLNPQQLEAASHTEGPLLILAGAGTGKTKVLTTRLAHIITSGKAWPNEVLAVTFTNKAAKEMAERVTHLIGKPVAGMWLGTFHSLGARMLRQHAEMAGLEPNFTIMDADDQQRIAKQLVTDFRLDEKRFPPRALASLISRWKDNAWTVNDLPRDEAQSFMGRGLELYRAYEEVLRRNNSVDFGDLLLKTFVLLRDNPDVLARYQRQFKYVLVDEYQDTNSVQYLWLRLLVMAHKNICVVGDDDQSIYAWRGAQVGNILRFEKDFPGAKVVKLEQNYRSTGHILKAASSLISHNEERHDKTLWTQGTEGAPVELHVAFDGRDEARFVSDRIEREAADGLDYNHMAVLVRTAAQTRAFEEQFMRSGVPYRIVGGLRFYERKEIKDAVAYLRLVASERDNLAFERIVNVPKRGIGETGMGMLAAVARERGCSLFQASQAAVKEGLVSPRIMSPLHTFVRLIEDLRKRTDETTPDRLMEALLEDSGYLDMLRKDKDEEAKSRLENLKELVRAMQEYSDIPSFLEHVALVNDESGTQENAVNVTTVHAAKGLEFDTVFVPGFEEGLFPHSRAMNEGGEKGLEEERRLAYVALTRAKRQLILSYTGSRYMYGSFQPSVASRFLEEIPAECLRAAGGASDGISGGGASGGHGGGFGSAAGFGGRSQGWRPSVGSTADRQWGRTPVFYPTEGLAGSDFSDTGAEAADSDADYAKGQRIFHEKFGYGVVRGVEGSGESQRLTVWFDKAGEKKLVAALANLKRVS